MLQHREVVRKEHRVEPEALQAAAMHRCHLGTMAGHPDKPNQSLLPPFDQGLECTARTKRSLPLALIDEVVKLNEIDFVHPQPLERPLETRARPVIGAIAGFGGEKESLAMLAHPGSDSELGITIRRGGIDMIDSVFEEDLENAIGAILPHTS